MGEPFVFEKDASGIVASHPPTVALPVVAAPVPEEQKATHFNAIRDPLVILGCKDLPDDHFEFDSSFLLPRSARAFTKLADFLRAHQARDAAKRFPPSALFGHADPTGAPGYNRMLSGRRATAVYGVLTKNPAVWEDLFSNGYGGDAWGLKSEQTMLSISLVTLPSIGLPEAPFYPGEIDGGKTEATRRATGDAIDAWRQARGLGPGRTLGAAQRAQLFREYMDAIGDGPDFKLQPTDFIAKGQGGAALKGDVMGCGEFNPRFLLTDAAAKAADQDPDLRDARNEAYAVNRRVIVYVFKPGTEISPAKWPCPIARSEDGRACQKRFWSDGDKRRAEAADERTFGEDMTHLSAGDAGQLVETPVEQTGNTMACRFYHGFARYSPCEAKFKEWVVRFQVAGFNGQVVTLKNRRFVAVLGESASAPEMRGTTDDLGAVRLPVISEQTKMRVKVDAARDLEPDEAPPADGDDAADDESRFVTVELAAGDLEVRDTDNDLAIKQRLYNLGFGENPPERWDEKVDGQQTEFERALAAFRVRTGLENASDADVRQRIVQDHDLADPEPPAADEAPAAAPAADA